VLEILVHSQVREPAALTRHHFIKIEIPDDTTRQVVDEAQLPTDWSRRPTVTRAWGNRWLRAGQSALLVVRSVLVPRHADAAHIQLLAVIPYPLDSRLVPRD